MEVAYESELQQELVAVNPVFHASMLKNFTGDPSLIIPTENIEIKYNLSYEDIPEQISRSPSLEADKIEVASVKVLWRNQFI